MTFSPPGCCWASELSFLLEPSDVIAVRERPLLLDCRVQGDEPIMVTWRRNGVPVPTSARVQVLSNGTLLIRSFQKRKEGGEGDMGEYDCAAQNRYGLLVSRKARVLLACEYGALKATPSAKRSSPGWNPVPSSTCSHLLLHLNIYISHRLFMHYEYHQ